MTGSYILIPHGNKDSGLFCACSTQLEEAKFICSTTGPYLTLKVSCNIHSCCFKLSSCLICSYWKSFVTPPIEQTTRLVHLQFISYLIGPSPQIYRVVLSSSPPCPPLTSFPCCPAANPAMLSPSVPSHSLPPSLHSRPVFFLYSLCRPCNALYLFLQLRHDCNIIVAGRSHIRAGRT